MANKVFGVDSDNRVDIPNGLRNAGADGGDGIFNEYFNQALFEAQADHIWGTQSQVTVDPAEATFYTDGSGIPRNAAAAQVTINKDDKILIRHNVTQTANLLLDAGGVKITIEMYGGVTLAMDTFDLTIGGSGDSVGGDIRITQTGNLVINGNRGTVINNSVLGVFEDFKTKNLIINVQSNTTSDLDADNIVFIDEFGNGIRVDDINETFDITTDRPDGTGTTNELPSTIYQKWLDKDLNKALVPDLTGTADSDVATELRDSGAAFQTHLVQPGDIVFNLDDLIQGTVISVDSETAITLSADIFPDGNESYKIRMLSPVGLGPAKARIGAAYNNSSSNFDNSTYTQIQEEKIYFGNTSGTLDFTLDGTGVVSTNYAEASVFQVNDWTGKGVWKFTFNFEVTTVSAPAFALDISGVIFKTGISQSISCRPITAISTFQASASSGVGQFSVIFAVNQTNWSISESIECDKKPTFHN